MMWNNKYVQNENVITRQLAELTVLVPIRGQLVDLQQLFTLNPVAEFIWRRLDGRTPMESILQAALDTYQVERDQVAADAESFIRTLLQRELIVEVP
ncbi:MAG TPA: PqqD family protein [Acidobacteriota bacterium]|nr:PqqD family protein [Acidobacteriota bacterium]HQF85791.1 PqqD family protein [Acidobacteriota bacterium]HQK88563.1 PqqD family protein [Acidobacteriota bacterium]